ncbi:hypothetical protein KC363_g142 [Hortaea werneckii]|nr:hypothetical protein KC363_g142 [Hortaea werneckii]
MVGDADLAEEQAEPRTVPSSPGAKLKAEQNPSEDVIRSVWPSLDQVRHVLHPEWQPHRPRDKAVQT